MEENKIKEVKEMVGDVVLKTSFAQFEVYGIKDNIEPEKFNALKVKVDELAKIRHNFAHEIPLINTLMHPGEVFLSIDRRSPSWLDRLDGVRINELYTIFIKRLKELENELTSSINELKLRENKPKLYRVMESPATGTASIKEMLAKPPSENS